MAVGVAAAALLIACAGGARAGAAGGDAPARESDGTGALAPGEHTAQINGLRLWYKVSGRGPVCLLPNPPWGPSCDYLFRTLKPLEERFTLVYLDNRGCGRSQNAASTREYTWDHLVADVHVLREHLGQEKVWLMGHSAGGWQVLHYAVQHPRHVNGLVLLSSSAWQDRDDIAARLARRRHEPWFADAEKAWRTRTDGPPPPTDEAFQALIGQFFPLYWADPARIAPHAAHFAARPASSEAFRGQRDSKRHPFDLRPRLASITAPALVVVGDRDPVTSPKAAMQLHLGLPRSKLLLIEDAGHFPWLEQPDAFFRDVPAFLHALSSPAKHPDRAPQSSRETGDRDESETAPD